MKHLLACTVTLFLAVSCQFFETEKISSERFYEEGIDGIDWTDVDSYPTFTECTSFTEKVDQKECFETSLTRRLYTSIRSQRMYTRYPLNDTVVLTFSISSEGLMEIRSMEIDSMLRAEFPNMERWIRKSVDSLPQPIPAYKRGIPVRTEFTLPIVIQTPL